MCKQLSQASFGFDSGTSASGRRWQWTIVCRRREEETETTWSFQGTEANRTNFGFRCSRRLLSSTRSSLFRLLLV